MQGSAAQQFAPAKGFASGVAKPACGKPLWINLVRL
jgi:hypothetical protein